MTFNEVSVFAQSWGLVFLVTLFLAACGYALWPGNRARFEKAARLPLEEE